MCTVSRMTTTGRKSQLMLEKLCLNETILGGQLTKLFMKFSGYIYITIYFHPTNFGIDGPPWRSPVL